MAAFAARKLFVAQGDDNFVLQIKPQFRNKGSFRCAKAMVTTMIIQKHHEIFIGCEKEYSEADIVLFGAPFDGTVSYRPGTRFGPRAIRSESFGLETYSPYQDADLEEASVCDLGDLELGFGNPTAVISAVEETASELLNDGKLPFLFGGEHLVTLGAVRAAYQKYPDLHLIHIDAHTDLRVEYLGETLSHASVIRRCHDFLGDGRIHQFGIRSGERTEFAFAKEHTALIPFSFSGLSEKLETLRNKPVYLTVDLDVMDPSVFPGTGTPEPGGVSFDALRQAAESICRRTTVIACDMVELSPPYDASGISTAAACKLTREMLIALTQARKSADIQKPADKD